MKRLVFLLLSAPLFLHAQDETGIKWTAGLSWEQIKAKAKAENKYIFIDCFTTWCAPCKKMDSEVYNNDSVGNYVNERFLPIKLQMDTTGNDNDLVKSWHPLANKIHNEYLIGGYPTILFFAPDGRLAYKVIGYYNTVNLISIAKKALNPDNLVCYEELENYKRGHKKYENMGQLAIFVKQVLSDKNFAFTIAQDYKKNYFDALGPEKLLNKDRLQFISQFTSLIDTKDDIFHLCYINAKKVNEVLGKAGWAEYQVKQAITRKEIHEKLTQLGKPIFKKPDWEQIKNLISVKYKDVDARLIVLDYQILYFSLYEMNCKEWVKYKDKRVKYYPPKADAFDIYVDLNTKGTWYAFLNCSDKSVLTKSIEWIDLALKLDTTYKAAYLDTKASALYKLGRVKEALEIEAKALTLDTGTEGYDIIYEQMKHGQPIYVDNGAIWDKKTLLRIKTNRK